MFLAGNLKAKSWKRITDFYVFSWSVFRWQLLRPWIYSSNISLYNFRGEFLQWSWNQNRKYSIVLKQSDSNVDEVTHTKLLGVNNDNHLSFPKHIDAITQTANRKCHGLVVLKWAGINTSSLVVLYQSQIRPSVAYSAAACYPYTTGTQQEQLEMTQKLALRIIFPEVEHYCDRLEMAGINTLCIELDLICRKYAMKVYQHPDHVLHDRIPRRPAGQRFSRRVSTSDIYIPKTRTDKCGKSVLRNLKFFA